MTHDDALLLVSAVADDEAAATGDLAAHLAECADCAAYAAGVARLSALTAALPREPAPATLPARVAALTRRARRRRWALRLAPALAAATAAAVVATALPGDPAPVERPAPLVPAAFRLPPAAAAGSLLRLRSLYLERTVTIGDAVTRERIWWRAPGSVRVEGVHRGGDGSVQRTLVLRGPGFEVVEGRHRAGLPPSITLPEPLSPAIAVVGTDAGPGPVVAGLPTRTYEIAIGGHRRTAHVATGVTLGATERLVLGKVGTPGTFTKTTQVVRLNPDLDDALFRPAGRPREDAGFVPAPLDEVLIAPVRVPEGFEVVRAGRGPQGEALLLANASFPVLVTAGDLTGTGASDLRVVRRGGRAYRVSVDLYAPPSVQITTAAGPVTVSAPLPLESLVDLATGMYGLE